MSALSPLGELRQALAEGLAQPRHAREALAIALALAGAWILARILTHALARRSAVHALRPGSGTPPPAGALRHLPGRAMVDSLGAGSVQVVRRVLFLLLALALLWAAEGILRWQHILSSAADARLLRLAMSLLGLLAAVRILFALLQRVLRRSPLNAAIERGIAIAAVVGFVLYATGAWDDVVAWLVATEIPLGAASRVSLWSMLVGSVTTLVALLAAMWLGTLVEERLHAQTALEPNLRTVLGRVVRALLVVVAVLLALALSGINLTVLSVFGGALGVGLGLGLQRIASNYVSGFILLLDRSLRIGDLVAVDKYNGHVTEIRTRCTVLRAADGTDALVPNEMLVSSPVVNLTLNDRQMVVNVLVVVGPQTDVAHAQQLLCEAARSIARVLPEPAPVALLKEFHDGNLLLEVDFWIADPQNGRDNIRSDVAIAILQRLRAAGIPLAAPQFGGPPPPR